MSIVEIPSQRKGTRMPAEPLPRGPRAADVVAVLSGRVPIVPVFQPIVDLQRGTTAGYEALSRFPSTLVEGVGPDAWFAAADSLGLGPQLEAKALRAALAARQALPSGCFLSVNVSPHLVAEPEILDALGGDLRGVIVELTEHVRSSDERSLLHALTDIKSRGAIVALDDAGNGYAGLNQVMTVRPGLVKLDRSLVEGVDRDPAKRTLARLLGSFAGELDAWLLAEGIETLEELQVFLALGVPLAQGYLLGRPAPTFEPLDPQFAARIRAASHLVRAKHRVASLVTPVVTRRIHETSEALLPRVVVDEGNRPVGLELASRASSPDGGVLTVHPADSVADAAARAMARPEARRWDPLVLTGGRGQVLGIVPMDALIRRLAELQQATENGSPATAEPAVAFPRGETHEEVRLR